MTKKETKKFEKINEKTNFKNFFKRTFWLLCNKLKYETVYFIDTNIAISEKSSDDKRVKKLKTSFKKIAVSEPIDFEIREKITNKKYSQKIHYRKKHILSMNELKEVFPNACPVYYNAISSMNNSAVINSPLFAYENMLFPILKKKDIDKKFYKTWGIMMGHAKKEILREKNIFDEKRTHEEVILSKAIYNAIRKKRKNFVKQTNNINDYKNIASTFIYSTFLKKNVVMVTADLDAIYAFLVWAETFIQQQAFMKLILEKISTENNYKDRIWKGETISLYINKKQYDELEDGLRGDFFNRDWKKSSFRYSIKFWDDKKQKYYYPVVVNFDLQTLDLIQKNHGGFTCPFCQNYDYGNWIQMTYYWPPRNDKSKKENLIEFKLYKKKNIYYESQSVPWVIHNNQCYFSNLDQGDKIKDISTFNEE